MNRAGTLGLCTLLAIATGCGHPAERAIAGRWNGERVENFERDDVAAATAWARGLSLEFQRSRVTVSVPAEEPRAGSYRLASVEERTVKLAVLDSEGQQSELEVVVDDEDHMRWMLGDGRAVVLRRAEGGRAW